MDNFRIAGSRHSGWLSQLLLAMMVVAAVAGACSSNPTSPTPSPTPDPVPVPVPTPDPPTLSCPAAMTASTTSAAGTAVTFTTPTASAGKEPVSVACTPASGSTFPLGATTVTCTATDALNRSATCTFPVTISRTPQLTLTKFLAFGDSVTAGEVSFPIAGILPQRVPNFGLRVVDATSYPTVLRNLLTARYTAQATNITVVNDGKSGEKVREATTLTRFANSVANGRPEVVLIMHGYNDIENGAVITASVSAVDALMAEARNRRVGRVFVVNLAPGRAGGTLTRPNSSIVAFNDRLQRAASGEGAVYVDIYSAMQSAASTYIGVDGLHPNEAGYRKIAETILAAIQANLEVR